MNTVKGANKRLDRTLSSEAFSYKESVSLIVKNQLLKSSPVDTPGGKLDTNKLLPGSKYFDEVTQHWSSKIWTFLDEIRSASTSHTGKLVITDDENGLARDWKLKAESERHRVMYREGPEGTPFHTLCLDGIVDGDFVSALCVAWESPLYKEWWPQFVVPPFKITESKYLHRIRVGEDLSLLRFKVPWPLAQREVLMSAFELEYLQDDLIIVVIESVPECEEINAKLHGYSADDLPAPSTNVRMDVTGGFLMQRISKDQFFFRTILNVDIKLDFVPPWLINFISRQLAGQGLKLYQKAVLAVSNGTGNGKAFQKLLKTGSMYERIRSSMEAKTAPTGDLFTSLPVERLATFKDSGKTKSLQGSIRRMGSFENYRIAPYPVKADETPEILVDTASSSVAETVQLRSHAIPPDTKPVEKVKPDVPSSSKQVYSRSKFVLSEDEVREYEDPELDWALRTLDKMILFTHSCAAEPSSTGEALDRQVGSTAGPSSTGEALDRQVESTAGPSSTQGALDRQVKSTAGPSSSRDALNNQVGCTRYSTGDQDARESLVHSKRKPPLHPVKNQSCNIASIKPASALKVTEKLENKESSGSPAVQSASEDTESSGTSGFWSATEIEIVSSSDDTDTDVGASGRKSSHSRGQEQKEPIKRRRSRWRWTCFSPSLPKKEAHARRNLYADDTRLDSGRASTGHFQSLIGDSNRFNSNRGYATERDEIIGARHEVDSRRHSPVKFPTLGDLLMDEKL